MATKHACFIAIKRGSEAGPGVGEDAPEDLLDLVELALADDQRRGELDDRVAAVVGPAVQALLVERLGDVAVEDALALVLAEGLLGVAVLHQLDAVEVAGAADVADDRQVP